MVNCKGLLRLSNKRIITIINGCVAVMAASTLCAATLQVGSPVVVLMAGETIEIPLSSTKPISGDLTASGAFQPGDVTFTPSPTCHLSARNCTLLVRAAPTSKKYTAVPVVVSESAATNTPVFALSVIHPGEPEPVGTKLPEINPVSLILSNQIGSEVTVVITNTSQHTLNKLKASQLPSGVTSSSCSTVAPGAKCILRLEVNDTPQTGYFVIPIKSDEGLFLYRILSVVAPTVPTISPHVENHTQAPLQRSGSTLFYGVAEPHPGFAMEKAANNDFTPSTNGPAYQIVKLTNNGRRQPLSISITGSGASSFSIDYRASDYGVNQNCASISTITSRESCVVIVKGKVGDPSQAPQKALLTIKGANNNVATFTLTTTTYVYVAGGFNTLGNASVSGGNLLAQCTAGSCSNALQGTTGNNFAETSFSVGQWINALAITPAGNLMVGGVFGAIGGATSGATSGTAALLAQCTPGVVTGNACFNQISGGTPYAFNNAYIDGITSPNSGTSAMYLGGDFANIRAASVSAGQKMLARCVYDGTFATSCTNYLTSSRYANAAISAVDDLGTSGGTPFLNVGGLFTQIANYPSPAPTSGTTFARCTTTSCSQGMGSNNPNGSIIGMTNDGTNLYMGGTFTQIGGYTDSNGGYPLVSCTVSSTTTCSNALADPNDANGYIEGLAYSGGNLYVGGNFTTIGTATPVSGGNMLAVCTVGGACSNFVTDTNPYATGTDWGGGIFAIAIGNQTSIAAN